MTFTTASLLSKRKSISFSFLFFEHFLNVNLNAASHEKTSTKFVPCSSGVSTVDQGGPELKRKPIPEKKTGALCSSQGNLPP